MRHCYFHSAVAVTVHALQSALASASAFDGISEDTVNIDRNIYLPGNLFLWIYPSLDGGCHKYKSAVIISSCQVRVPHKNWSIFCIPIALFTPGK